MNKEQLSFLLETSTKSNTIIEEKFMYHGHKDMPENTKFLLENGYIEVKDLEYSTTEKGEELIKALIITSNFFETQNSIKKDAEDLLVKAKDKYNSLLDTLKL